LSSDFHSEASDLIESNADGDCQVMLCEIHA